MEFQLYPVTLNFWANYLIAQWDLYVTSNPLGFPILNFDLPGEAPTFKSESMEDYHRFRSFMQIIDLLVLDLNTFRYEKR